MADASWFQLVSVAMGSGLTVKALDIVYQEIQKRREVKSTSELQLEQSLDPLLKALDELVGKIRSLAQQDFLPLGVTEEDPEGQRVSLELASLLYLFTGLWARIEVLRRESLYRELSTSQRGKQLQSFINCLESRRIRLVDRGVQRACAELTLGIGQDRNELVSYTEYTRCIANDPERRFWISPLVLMLGEASSKTGRQSILRYGTVLHSMIDTLDPDHRVTKARPPFSNKLSRKTRADLKFRVFAKYLPFVSQSAKYHQPGYK